MSEAEALGSVTPEMNDVPKAGEDLPEHEVILRRVFCEGDEEAGTEGAQVIDYRAEVVRHYGERLGISHGTVKPLTSQESKLRAGEPLSRWRRLRLGGFAATWFGLGR